MRLHLPDADHFFIEHMTPLWRIRSAVAVPSTWNDFSLQMQMCAIKPRVSIALMTLSTIWLSKICGTRLDLFLDRQVLAECQLKYGWAFESITPMHLLGR